MSKVKVFMALIFIVFIILVFSIFLSEINNLSGLKSLVFTTSAPYNIYQPLSDFNEKLLPADDVQVVETLKASFLFPPSSKPYNLSQPEELNPSMGQAQKIDYILNNQKKGFFIECGALDGETRSNSLFFERERDWSGLLIEADPKNFESVVAKNRKAYTSPTCLAPSTHPASVEFQQQSNLGHIVGEFHNANGGPEKGSVIEVQCFPLLTYMKALNVTTIDYFSLDVEGAEFSILKVIPWDKINIRTLSVEFIHDKEDKSSILHFMRSKGYSLHSEVTHVNWLANDFIFVKNDLFKRLNSVPAY